MITSELRVGVKLDKKILKEFKLKTLKISELKRINDDDYRRNHPVRWLAQTLMILVDNIGGEVPAMNGREFPDVIKNLSLIDVSYLLIAGHVYNLGSEIKSLRTVCPCQRQQEVSLDVDLNNLEDEENYPDPTTEFTVELPHGVEINLPNMEDLGLKGKVWKYLTFRIPILGDMLKNEKHFSASAKSDFGERVISACILKAEAEDGTELPASLLKMFGDKLIGEMTARDMQATTREFNKFPSHRLFCETQCSYCDKEITTPIEPNFLFIAA